MKSHPKVLEEEQRNRSWKRDKKKKWRVIITQTLAFYYYYGKQIHFIDKKQQYNRPKRRNKHSLAHILYTLSIKKIVT